MFDEELAEHVQDILAVEFAPGMNSKAFPAIFIDHREHTERLSIMGSVHYEIVAPDVVAPRWP